MVCQSSTWPLPPKGNRSGQCLSLRTISSRRRSHCPRRGGVACSISRSDITLPSSKTTTITSSTTMAARSCPLASADTAGAVIYIGSLSKTLAPGLRLGYVVASQPVIAHLTEYRALLDTQGDGVLESAVAELIEDGELQRHVRKSRRLYRARRDA